VRRAHNIEAVLATTRTAPKAWGPTVKSSPGPSPQLALRKRIANIANAIAQQRQCPPSIHLVEIPLSEPIASRAYPTATGLILPSNIGLVLESASVNKARRGELEMRPPVGLVYNAAEILVLDPDQQVQHCLRWLFATFRQTGSAMATARAARHQGLAFPRRCGKGPHQGELLWADLDHSHVLRILHNPRYAGAFVYGRTHTRKTLDGGTRIRNLPREQWDTLIPDAHVGYLSWEEYEHNQKRLHESAQAMGADRRRGPPREGPALLQGLVVCGRCGNRMTVRYHSRNGHLCPEYVCQREGIEHAEPVCQRVPGVGIDRAISELLIEAVNPVALEVTLAVQRELQCRMEEADRLRHKQVERAQYESDLAQRRYMRVDPDNRLVADSLEADWNHKLRTLTEAHQEYARRREQDARVFTDE
jgi:hypothetical protein